MPKIGFLSFKYGNLRTSPFKPAPTSIPGDKQRSGSSTQVFQPNMAEMKQVFDKFDTNRDGKISRLEYKKAVKSLGSGNAEREVVAAFEVLDVDGDGAIDFEEFMKVHSAGRGGGGVKATDIRTAFRVFDLDGDGKISANEVFEVLKKLGEKRSLGSCREIVRRVDKDGDGLIDINEFMTMMTQTLKLC